MIPLWTRRAQDSLETIYSHIAEKRRDPVTAARVTSTIVETANTTLSEHPRRGRPGRVKDTRELVIAALPNFIVAYALIDDRPVILRVMHGAQDWPESF